MIEQGNAKRRRPGLLPRMHPPRGERRWCHATCCSGETELTGEPFNEHDAQLLLDSMGCGGCGRFGAEHGSVLRAIVLAWRRNRFEP